MPLSSSSRAPSTSTTHKSSTNNAVSLIIGSALLLATVSAAEASQANVAEQHAAVKQVVPPFVFDAVSRNANNVSELLAKFDASNKVMVGTETALPSLSGRSSPSGLSDILSQWSLFGFPFQNSVAGTRRNKEKIASSAAAAAARRAVFSALEEASAPPPLTVVAKADVETTEGHASGAEETGEESEEADATSLSKQLWFVILANFVLLCFAALFAGLTLAVMGLDTLSLEIIASSGAEPDRSYAARILPLRRKGNQLLSTLVLGNVMVNTLIAQVTDGYAKGWIATAVSTALITVGGEIVPQALMSAHALYIGSRSAPVTKLFMFLFYPICKPVAMFLDMVIGSDPGQIYNRNELKKLMVKHCAHTGESGVDRTDLDLMVGAIDLKEKSVIEVLTPLAEVFMLEANRRVNEELLQQICEKGHSRIPIYSVTRNNVIGVLLAKDLLLANPEDNTRIGDFVMFYQRKFHTVPSETKLYSMLRYFQTGASHIALVQEVQQIAGQDPFYSIKGVVTLEDVMEELLQREILDEHDVESAAAFGGGVVSASMMDGNLSMKIISRRKAARTQRRIHLSANQLTACALFLQRSLSEFKNVDVQQLAGVIATHATVYKIRPPQDAAGLPWRDSNTILLYGPSEYAAVNEDSAIAHCSAVMTLIISGRCEVAPSVKNRNYTPSSCDATLVGEAVRTAPIVDASVISELPSWSLINVSGMRNTSSTTTSTMTMSSVLGAVTTTTSTTSGAAGSPIDYYCRVVAESLVMQISHTQYRLILAALEPQQ